MSSPSIKLTSSPIFAPIMSAILSNSVSFLIKFFAASDLFKWNFNADLISFEIGFSISKIF